MKQLGIEVEATFTQKRPDGSYKKVVMGTAASLEEGDDPSGCRRMLFEDLAEDLKACFSNNSKTRPLKNDYPEPPIPKGTKTTTKKRARPKTKKKARPKTKMCSIHKVPKKLFTKNGGEWYSHNDETTGGEWCNGKKRNK